MADKGKTETITETETDASKKDFKGPNITGKKSSKKPSPASEVVTGEVVLENLRKKGVNI